MSRFDVAVIGGGASGMLTAVMLKRLSPALSVVVLERQARVGKKLLATGNGRCNITNMNLSARCYPGGADFARAALERFPPREVLFVFESLGLFCAPDEQGRVYPVSDQAASALDALRLALQESGVSVLTGFEVQTLTRGFGLTSVDGQTVTAQSVVLATGGPAGAKLGGSSSGHKLMKALGHPVTRCLPALVQLKTDPELVRALKGIRAACRVRLVSGEKTLDESQGEVLFTEYGLSGIAAMALGKTAAEAFARGARAEISLCLTPFTKTESLARLEALTATLPARALEDLLSGLLPKRLGQTLVKSAGIGPLTRTASSLTADETRRLSRLLIDWRLPLSGTRGFDDAQVTSGGLDTRFFDPVSMESSKLPGLYATGEVLDVDGQCGGYNLHWAWASALAAAHALAKSFKGA